MQTPYVLITRLEAQPGKEEAVKLTIASIFIAHRKENSPAQYKFYQDLNNPAQFVAMDIWPSAEARSTYVAGIQPYIKELIVELQPMLVQPMQVTHTMPVDY